MFYSTTTPMILLAALALAPAAALSHEKQSTLGTPAPVSAATQTIKISALTKYVNVMQGDIVKFEVDGKDFAWQFDTIRPEGWLDLALFAPKSVNTYGVRVFIGANSLYQN